MVVRTSHTLWPQQSAVGLPWSPKAALHQCRIFASSAFFCIVFSHASIPGPQQKVRASRLVATMQHRRHYATVSAENHWSRTWVPGRFSPHPCRIFSFIALTAPPSFRMDGQNHFLRCEWPEALTCCCSGDRFIARWCDSVKWPAKFQAWHKYGLSLVLVGPWGFRLSKREIFGPTMAADYTAAELRYNPVILYKITLAINGYEIFRSFRSKYHGKRDPNNNFYGLKLWRKF